MLKKYGGKLRYCSASLTVLLSQQVCKKSGVDFSLRARAIHDSLHRTGVHIFVALETRTRKGFRTTDFYDIFPLVLNGRNLGSRFGLEKVLASIYAMLTLTSRPRACCSLLFVLPLFRSTFLAVMRHTLVLPMPIGPFLQRCRCRHVRSHL